MLGFILPIVLVAGGFFYGRDFLAMVWTFIRDGIPEVWEKVTAGSYYQAVFSIFRVAVAYPIIGTAMALFVARYDPETARIIVFLTYLPSAAIFGVLLILTDTFAAIGVTLLTPTENTRETITHLRIGLRQYFATYLAWELFVGFLLFLLGVDATIWVLAVSVWGIILYTVAAYVFNKPMAWVPKVMMRLGIGACIVVLVLLTAMLFPPSRRYAASLGINPSKFVHRGVVDTSRFDAAEKTAQEKLREICDVELQKIKSDLDAIKPETNRARAVLEEKMKELAKKQQECL